jgi:hypothetical protein
MCLCVSAVQPRACRMALFDAVFQGGSSVEVRGGCLSCLCACESPLLTWRFDDGVGGDDVCWTGSVCAGRDGGQQTRSRMETVRKCQVRRSCALLVARSRDPVCVCGWTHPPLLRYGIAFRVHLCICRKVFDKSVKGYVYHLCSSAGGSGSTRMELPKAQDKGRTHCSLLHTPLSHNTLALCLVAELPRSPRSLCLCCEQSV